jgi:hypothetical protein
MARAALIGAATLLLAVPALAADPPTIIAEPAIVGNTFQLVLSGNVPSREAGQKVEIEAKDCRGSFFRVFGGATTAAGGAWSYDAFIRANTTFRARWKDAASRPILVQRRAAVALERRHPTRTFLASVWSPEQNMVGRLIRLERLTQNGWVTMRSAKLRRLAGPTYAARFRAVPRGLQLRSAMSDASARPCYAAGVSPIVRS